MTGYSPYMGILVSLLVFALGAVLVFAVRAEPSGLDLTAVGLIFMLVSLAGLAISLYRDHWRRKIVEESIEHGVPVPFDLDESVLVDPAAPVEAPVHPETQRIHQREIGPAAALDDGRDAGYSAGYSAGYEVLDVDVEPDDLRHRV